MLNAIIQLVIATKELPGDDRFSAGWLGGLFFALMAAAVVFLWRNMNSRLKKLDKKYDEQDK
ncbi:MAG: hypothetical protein RIS43_895 [Actinomycetota bacterium]|jgi:membrane protein CcdC involved in cytochrome C biogenesis